MEQQMNDSSPLPKVQMLVISTFQGILLYALYSAFDNNTWPSDSPLWSYPLWTFAVAVPLLLLLSLTRSNIFPVTKYVAGFAVVLALLAAYTGWQAEPFGEFPVSNLSFAFAFSIGLACFKALMYLQQRANEVPLTYQVLFTNSWRNFLVAALSAVFVLVFWLVLVLWGQLFKVIEIDFFHELFIEDWFIFPVLSIAFGLGVIMFRGLMHVIDNISKLLHWLIKLLLPLVVAIAVIFLAALPIVGLDVLWSTGRGTALLLWLLALMLFFTNAVYQDGREASPYPVFIHRAIYVGLCVMPIVSALSFYGLVLRLNQYGWTVGRSWAFVVWLVLALFALGYVVGIVRRRGQWTNELARVNTAMGLIVLVIMLLANSPALDFRKISLRSQLARVDTGEIEMKDFDFYYAKNQLGRPGYLAMDDLKKEIGDSNPELVRMIEKPTWRNQNTSQEARDKAWENMNYRPAPFEVPAELRPLILDNALLINAQDTILFQIDLDRDGVFEYLRISTHRWGLGYAQFYYETDDGWRAGGLQYSEQGQNNDALRDLLNEGTIELVEPRFKHVRIGNISFQPIVNNN
jgi:hypothetical protein